MAVAWKTAKVPPAEAPSALLPPWLPLLFAGGLVLLLVLWLIRKQRPAA